MGNTSFFAFNTSLKIAKNQKKMLILKALAFSDFVDVAINFIF